MKLYVGNIALETSESVLKEFFANCAEVKEVKVITDHATGQSRGFAFIEMATKDAGEKAISELNGKELGGRQLKVNKAQDKKDKRR